MYSRLFAEASAWRFASLLALAALTAACSEHEPAAAPVTPAATDARASASTDPPSSVRTQRACAARAVVPSEAAITGHLVPLPEAERPEFAERKRKRVIAGDPRVSLPGIGFGIVLKLKNLDFPDAADPRLRLRLPLDENRYAFDTRVAIAPRLRLGDWARLPPQLHDIRKDADGRFVEIELDLAEASSGYTGPGRLEVDAYPTSNSPHTRYKTPPIFFPPQSAARPWLEFALGLPEVAWQQGAVRFRLEACSGEACECLHEEVVDPAEPDGRRWQDRILPIDDLAGRTLELVFSAESITPSPDGFVFAQWAVPRILEERPETDARRPNVLLISLDTLGARHLGAFGYPRETSPFMSGPLLERSVLFTNAVAPSTTTSPSHMTLFTSLQPSIHGVASNLRNEGLPEPVDTLASVFAEAGYATGSINENGAITFARGFGRGFDYYVAHDSATVLKLAGFVGDTFDSGIRYIERHPHQPWLLFLHTYEVHHPYTPPRAYAGLFPEGDDPDHPHNRSRGLGPGRSDYYPVLYDREIRHTDTELERLFARLAEMGVLDDTIVVVTSDHGEAFFEHEFLGHGSDVHEPTTHIPLYFTGADLPAGRRVATPVGLIDVMPTLMDLAGIERGDRFMMGRSFAPLVRGKAADPTVEVRPIVSEAWQIIGTDRQGSRTIIPPTLAVRRGSYKLIRYKGESAHRYLFYDLSADPDERHDLYPQRKLHALSAEIAELQLIADNYERESAALTRRMGLPSLQTDTPGVEGIDPDHLEALKALGYVE